MAENLVDLRAVSDTEKKHGKEKRVRLKEKNEIVIATGSCKL